jgi:CrcB protein
MVDKMLVIGLGGFAGAVLRYGISQWTHSMVKTAFPLGTFVVNIIGAFLLGLLFIFFDERQHIPAHVKLMLTVGLLGALTTFSTFSMETLQLFLSGELFKAGLNIFASVLVSIMAAWLGILLGRSVF